MGHFTKPGRKAAIEVANRFFYFFLALFGRRNKDVVAAYDIIGQVERMAVDSVEINAEDRNRLNLRYSQVIEATIAPRAILLQLVPWLTIWSVFSIATSRSAMWAPRESDRFSLIGKEKRKKKKKDVLVKAEGEQQDVAKSEEVADEEEAKVFPWLIGFMDAFERAKHEDNGRWKKRRWITCISALRIIVLHSRAIQYLVSSYMTFVSVWVLFHPANKAVLASIVLVLLPLAIAQGLGVVLVIGKALNVKDLLDVGSPGNKEKTAKKQKEDGKKESKSEEAIKKEIKDMLIAELGDSQRKLREPTEDEDEDRLDFIGTASENEESSRDVEMTTHRHRPHQSIAEAILPARSSIIPRDSIGPEMAPSRLSFDGVEPPHRPSILARSSHNAHVLQAPRPPQRPPPPTARASSEPSRSRPFQARLCCCGRRGSCRSTPPHPAALAIPQPSHYPPPAALLSGP